MKSKAIILMFLVILTTIFVSAFSTSKYASQNVNSDSSRAAMFIVDASSEDESIDIDCNETDTTTYTLKVTNKDKDGNISEVATSYKIIVTFEEKLPEGATMKLYNDDKEIEQTVSSDQLTYTFNDAGKLSAGIEDEQELKLKFSVDADNTEDFKNKKVSINIYSEQIN
jgi:uncharacterized protein YpmB